MLHSVNQNVMHSLSLMITYIRHRRYSTKSKYFGPFYYIQIDPQDYDEWRVTPPEEEIHFSGPNDEDEYQNLSSDDNQVIQQEKFCSEPPEPLSYSLFQSHFQEPSTSNTQKISLPKPIWEKPFKDQQQLIIDHNRSLPKSGSPHLPAPQQTAKSQQVHTHQSDESTTDTIKTETTPSDPLLAMAHQSINTSDDAASDISNVLSVKRSPQIQVCQCYLFQHANHTNQQLVDHGANGGLAGSDMHVIDRIPSTTPGAEPPRDAKDSGSARSHSMHLETRSSDRPKMVTYTEPQTVPSYIPGRCTRRTLRMPNFTPRNARTAVPK